MNVDAYVNLLVVAVCISIGKIIKSAPFMSKVENNVIPFTLMIVGIVLSFILGGDISVIGLGNSFSTGVISAAVAIGIHQSGKTVFSNIGEKPKKEIFEDE